MAATRRGPGIDGDKSAPKVARRRRKPVKKAPAKKSPPAKKKASRKARSEK